MRCYKGIIGLVIATLCILLNFSCSQDEPGGSQAKPVSVNLIFGQETQIGKDQYVYIDSETIYPSNGNNDYSDRNAVLKLGQKSLEDVHSLPNKRWFEKIDITESDLEKGCSYILQFYNDGEVTFAGMRITDRIYSESGHDQLIGIKTQIIIPFEVPVNLIYQARQVEAEEAGGEFPVEFDTPAPAVCHDAPDWIKVSFLADKALFDISPNVNISARTADVTIENSVSKVVVKVIQEGTNEPPFAGGDGTPKNPYLIATARQLARVRYLPDRHFKQIADIDMRTYEYQDAPTRIPWLPIENFTGSYDGGMFKILNLVLKNVPNAALFGSALNAKFYNIRVYIRDYYDSYITGESRAAGICTDAKNSSFHRCSVEGIIGVESSTGISAGIAIGSEDCTVTESYTRVEFSNAYGKRFHIATCHAENCYVMDLSESAYSGEPTYTAFGHTAKNCYATRDYIETIADWQPTPESPRFEYAGVMSQTKPVSCYSTYKTSKEDLKHKKTYIGWDFDNVWTIDEGVSYPRLRCFEK